MMSTDVDQYTGLSTFSNSLISVVRCPRDVTSRSRVNFLVVQRRVSRVLVAPQMVASSRVGDGRRTA